MAYNPAANGMVERAHRLLKAALMACCTNDNWKAQLPCFLPGLCIAPRADSDKSPAEKVYGETLAVPGDFFPTAPDDADTSLPRLREVTQKFVPCRKTFMYRTHFYSPGGMDTCTHVFIRIDAHRLPLTSLYRGPYCVISRSSKAYFINIHGREGWVSVDRLIPAFLLDSKPQEETSRCPSIPPQNAAADDPIAIPKRGRGHPKGCTKEVICSAKPPGDSAVKAAPRPQKVNATQTIQETPIEVFVKSSISKMRVSNPYNITDWVLGSKITVLQYSSQVLSAVRTGLLFTAYSSQ
ncbi:uncharacterized protein [Macrobrachium rosenbergii]|uniref:uncharacterized protein n=1 Tax=Macrobrachium rosenbergii TaxID=79674 RepID=UPI0034D568EF